MEVSVDIEKFAFALEKAGYEGALALIKEDIVPLAQSKHISLLEAAWEYADQDEEQDTSWFQLFHALQSISSKVLKSLDIHQPL
ncbi:MAG: hypothetical protein PHP03_00850 [Candidatus Pacebacteria bacterium]|nr:hypothetical protein [Candidatus Paceibacterota bacterium]